MAVRTYRLSGETLAEARKTLREFILEGKYLEKETVLSDGKPITLRQTGRTYPCEPPAHIRQPHALNYLQ